MRLERLESIRRSTRAGKKYAATVRDKRTSATRVLHFGASDYEQFKDRTSVGAFSHKDHGDRVRQRNYYTRHSGTPSRTEAIRLEWKRSGGRYTPKLLSHIYLW